MQHRYGFVSNLIINDEKLYMKSIKLATIEKLGLEKVIEIYRNNLETVTQILKYCNNNGIKYYRMGNLFPFNTHPILENFDYFKKFEQEIYELGQLIRVYDIRISIHSSPYCVLASDNINVVKSSINEIEKHAKFFDLLELPKNNRIVVHIGSGVGGKEKAIERFIQNYNKLSLNAKNRVALENDDQKYSIKDVLNVSEKCTIPIILDTFHLSIYNPEKIDIIDAVEKSTKTWKDGAAEIHYSEQDKDKIIGSHSENINVTKLLNLVNSVNHLSFDIMLETKGTNKNAEMVIKELQNQ